MLILLLSCAPPLDDACEMWCAQARVDLGICLEEEELTWDQLGYDGSLDYQDACETWAWERERIDREKGERGYTAGICREWTRTVDTCDEIRDLVLE